MNTRFVAGVAASMLLAASASAQLTIDVEHCVHLGPVLPAFFCLNGSNTYGSSSLISDGSGREWTATTPAPTPPPGYDRSMLCDFTDFELYWRSEINLTGIDIAVEPGSPVLLNAAGMPIGDAGGSGSTIAVKFFTTDLGAEPKAIIAWNDQPLCYPDCNGDAALTVADFGCFQTRFVAGDPYADCTGDGAHTVADFGCFQTLFVAGCP